MNIKYNNETIKNAIIDALDKMERGIEVDEVDRNELINVILKADRDFGIKNKDTGKYYTEEELQYSVYIHIVNENNKCYIGQTSRNPKDRWGSNGSGYEGQVFYNPIEYYGWDNISHVVLCYGLSEEEVNKMEIALISLFKSTNRDEFGYNVANGGDGKGKHSEETRQKISEAHKGKHLSEETRKKISEANTGEKHYMYGKHLSEETRKKMSEANTGEKHPMYGKHHSEETRKKMSEALKGEKHYMYGKQHSEETRKKMSEALKGENNPMYGKQHLEETRKKISEANKGENNPKAKKVYCNGVIFPTAKECAKFYNVNYGTMRSWLQGKRKTPSEFIELGLRYATQEDINTYPLYTEESSEDNKVIVVREGRGYAKKVYCGEMIFKSVNQCAKFYKVDHSTILYWLKHIDEINNYKFSKKLFKLLELGLRYATQEDIEKYPPYIEEEQNQQKQQD